MGFGGGPGGLNPISNALMGWGYNPISNPIDGSPPVTLGSFWGLPWLCDPIEGLRWTYGVWGVQGGSTPYPTH